MNMPLPMQHYPPQAQRGITIVELMVAMVIGLLLLAGIVQIFLGNRQTYRLQEAASAAQESGRFAAEFISREMRMAGSMGCVSGIVPVNNVDTTKHSQAVANLNDGIGLLTADGALRTYSYNGTFPAVLADIGLDASQVLEGTDIILVQHVEACPGGDVVCHNNSSTPGKTCSGVTGNTNSAEYKIADNTYCQIKQDDIVMVSNCTTADIHAVTNSPSGSTHVTIAHGANTNTSPKLSNAYGEGSAIYKLSVSAYYIGFGASGEPSLFRHWLQGTAFNSEELVAGVYDMELMHGIDSDADKIPNRYVAADEVDVDEWGTVTALRISFSTRSQEDNVMPQTTTYQYNGADISDRRLRRDFSSTIALRNRI